MNNSVGDDLWAAATVDTEGERLSPILAAARIEVYASAWPSLAGAVDAQDYATRLAVVSPALGEAVARVVSADSPEWRVARDVMVAEMAESWRALPSRSADMADGTGDGDGDDTGLAGGSTSTFDPTADSMPGDGSNDDSTQPPTMGSRKVVADEFDYDSLTSLTSDGGTEWPGAYDDGYVDGYAAGKSGTYYDDFALPSSGNARYDLGARRGLADAQAGKPSLVQFASRHTAAAYPVEVKFTFDGSGRLRGNTIAASLVDDLQRLANAPDGEGHLFVVNARQYLIHFDVEQAYGDSGSPVTGDSVGEITVSASNVGDDPLVGAKVICCQHVSPYSAGNKTALTYAVSEVANAIGADTDSHSVSASRHTAAFYDSDSETVTLSVSELVQMVGGSIDDWGLGDGQVTIFEDGTANGIDADGTSVGQLAGGNSAATAQLAEVWSQVQASQGGVTASRHTADVMPQYQYDWTLGVNDAKEGRPRDPNGGQTYDQGYNYGMAGSQGDISGVVATRRRTAAGPLNSQQACTLSPGDLIVAPDGQRTVVSAVEVGPIGAGPMNLITTAGRYVIDATDQIETIATSDTRTYVAGYMDGSLGRSTASRHPQYAGGHADGSKGLLGDLSDLSRQIQADVPKLSRRRQAEASRVTSGALVEMSDGTKVKVSSVDDGTLTGVNPTTGESVSGQVSNVTRVIDSHPKVSPAPTSPPKTAAAPDPDTAGGVSPAGTRSAYNSGWGAAMGGETSVDGVAPIGAAAYLDADAQAAYQHGYTDAVAANQKEWKDSLQGRAESVNAAFNRQTLTGSWHPGQQPIYVGDVPYVPAMFASPADPRLVYPQLYTSHTTGVPPQPNSAGA